MALSSASPGDANATPPVSNHLQDIAVQPMGLTVGAVALVGAGTFIHPVFRLLSVPVLLVGLFPSARRAWHTFRQQRRLDYAGLEVVQSLAELTLGYVALTAGGWLVFSGGQRILNDTRRGAKQELVDALTAQAEHAWLIRDGVELEVRLDQIQLGDLVAVQAGDPIPVDGRIVEGAIGVDQRALTGESRLQELVVGDKVLASTHVLSGSAVVMAESTGNDTVAARVEALLAGTASFEQTLQARVTRYTERSVRPTLAIAGFGFLTRGPIGILGGFWTNALDMAWISSPYSMVNTIQAAARAGILVKDGRSLEQLSAIDTVVFDKTGTLTLDEFEVVRVRCRRGLRKPQILRLAAAIEGHQSHPIARAIIETARRWPGPVPAVDQTSTEVGYGLRARVGGQVVVLGSRRLMEQEQVRLPRHVRRAAALGEARGHSLVYMAIAGRYTGMIELAPRVRPEAVELVARLQARGLEVLILTGDDEGPTRALAHELGITRYYARTLPEAKDAILAGLQAEGHTVCFVGDGINDALALHRANLSVSMSGASTLAIESAQVVLGSGSLDELETLFEIGDAFASDQRVILGSSLVSTALSVTGFLFAGFSLGVVVGVYIAGFGLSVLTSLMPRLRHYERRHRPEPPQGALGPAAPTPARPMLALPSARDPSAPTQTN